VEGRDRKRDLPALQREQAAARRNRARVAPPIMGNTGCHKQRNRSQPVYPRWSSIAGGGAGAQSGWGSIPSGSPLDASDAFKTPERVEPGSGVEPGSRAA
jgi:hypothetical protein